MIVVCILLALFGVFGVFALFSWLRHKQLLRLFSERHVIVIGKRERGRYL